MVVTLLKPHQLQLVKGEIKRRRTVMIPDLLIPPATSYVPTYVMMHVVMLHVVLVREGKDDVVLVRLPLGLHIRARLVDGRPDMSGRLVRVHHNGHLVQLVVHLRAAGNSPRLEKEAVGARRPDEVDRN